MDLLTSIGIAIITLFVIMDPFSSIGPFLALTKNCKEAEMRAVASKAVVIAGLIALVFAFGGLAILSYMGITLNDFKVAGGIVLALLGLENILGFSFSSHKNKESDLEVVAVLIATPLLTGPGLVSSIILLSNDYGAIPAIIGLFGTLVLSWLILLNSVHIKRIAGGKVIEIFSKVMGLLLIAMGIAYIKGGLIG